MSDFSYANQKEMCPGDKSIVHMTIYHQIAPKSYKIWNFYPPNNRRDNKMK